MKITILGGTGMVGSRIVTEAATRGHHVIAASRRPRNGRPGPPGDRPASAGQILDTAVDASTPDSLTPALVGADALVIALRPARGAEHLLGPLTRGVLELTGPHDIPTLVIGGSAPLRSPGDRAVLVADDPDFVPPQWRAFAAASAEQLRVCRMHSRTRWSYLSPPAILEPGIRTGNYRRGTDTLLVDAAGRSWISAEDLAVAAVDELERPAGDVHFTVVDDSDRR